MPVSQNGYSANDRSVITTYTVTKTGRKMALRVGPPGEMLADFIRWFDENIRDIDPGILDEWGYAERPIRGGYELSNHASGTAGDIDATKWPLSVEASRYLTQAEIDRVNAKLAEYQGCIRWGANYEGRKDPMHFEINRDASTVARVWAEIQASRIPREPDQTLVMRTQRAVGIPEEDIDGIWGPNTERRVSLVRLAAQGFFFPGGIDDVQVCIGFTGTGVDGIWGPLSDHALYRAVQKLQHAWGISTDGEWGSITERAWAYARAANYTG